MTHHGSPCWYELSTTPGALADAGAFYARVLGWSVEDAGMPDFTYHLAQAGGEMVAGLMEMPADVAGMPPFWLLYFAVEDADVAVAQMQAAGATVHRPVTPIPGTGRFAILADPQGAAFGVLEPLPGGTGTAYNAQKQGHGNWHELMCGDPKAAMGFYGPMFNWQTSRSMDMGAMGTYDVFAWQGTDIGGMLRAMPGPSGAGQAFWLPYFGVDSAEKAMARITAARGAIKNGPMEVPGPAYIVIATDPQGAAFAVVGPK
ncbi:VOC family protein [Phaeovulum sp. W22_SRMD_FR3]|uniref:VOC family protein n=1 Tax=Phaeovulum sp. W22_SRMD_FR3 TaxID=3240274 RepID=UPI003F9B68CA